MPGLMKTPRQKIGKAMPDFPRALPLESQSCQLGWRMG